MDISGTPRKRRRRTNAELEALDEQLWYIVKDNQPCTVRQAYDRAVVAYLCKKMNSGYNLIQRRLLTMRRAGRLPYAWIQDNARTYYGQTRYRGLEDFAIAASRSLYHYDYWADAPVNVEMWCQGRSAAVPTTGKERRPVRDGPFSW